jgi:hypothetical protein
VGLVRHGKLCYTTYFSLSLESYSLNVRVGNPQLPNYLHSFEGKDKFHRPEEKNREGKFKSELNVLYLLVKCLEIICLLLGESNNRQVILSEFMDS